VAAEGHCTKKFPEWN